MRYLLDTTVVIDHAIGVQGAIRVVRDLYDADHELATCEVVTCEALSGGTADERHTIRRFLQALEYLPLGRLAAEIAGELRRAGASRGRRDLGDALIAGLALAEGAIVVTRNRADFDRHGVPVLEYGIG